MFCSCLYTHSIFYNILVILICEMFFFPSSYLCIGESFIASFTFIAAGVMGMHYESLLDVFGQCPTPFAFGRYITKYCCEKSLFFNMRMY